MGDVIKMKPPPGSELLYLPECPIKACAKCGADSARAGWIDLRIGCGACTPELVDLSLEMAGQDGRIFLLEQAIRDLRRKLPALGPSIDRVLSDLKLEIPTDE